jgi:hypothetical protein
MLFKIACKHVRRSKDKVGLEQVDIWHVVIAVAGLRMYDRASTRLQSCSCSFVVDKRGCSSFLRARIEPLEAARYSRN